MSLLIIAVAFIIFVGGGYIVGVNRNRAAAKAELAELEANVKAFAQKEWGIVNLWIARQRERLK